jgi:hypothetical protein
MYPQVRKVVLAALLAGFLGVAHGARAQGDPGDVYCGSVAVFRFRVAAEGKEPEARAVAAMDVLNKYLGGSVGKVGSRPAGKNVRLLLNGEVIATITPADAAAEKARNVNELAARWSRQLSAAFEATKAVR